MYEAAERSCAYLETMEKIWDEYQVYSNDEMEHADDTIKMLNPEQEDHKT